MSKTTIIYAHPYEKSFNHAILERVQALLDAKGQEYRLIDLYADGFNPVYTKEELALFREGKALDPLVLQYQQALKDSKRLIFIFPIWWADMPAIVKGSWTRCCCEPSPTWRTGLASWKAGSILMRHWSSAPPRRRPST